VEDPDTYTMVCNAEMAGVSIYDPFIVHPNYWESNPEQSAAYIDAVYKANEWILANRDAAVDKMAEFYVEIGTDASRAAVEADVDARTWYTLDSAIEAYESGEALAGYNALAEFFVSVGNWEAVPDIQPAVDAGLEVLKAAKEYRGGS
jgi:ABC-type nitrate/sulfonate/bicarbonate transport system substrate-binding protein